MTIDGRGLYMFLLFLLVIGVIFEKLYNKYKKYDKPYTDLDDWRIDD